MGVSRGLFIVVEGPEGAGKTTQVARLGEWLEAQSLPHRVAREPGGTRVGEAIRGVLLERAELDMPAETELLLMLAARAAYVREVVEPTLAEGGIMISDRFELSTFAYQGIARGLGLHRVKELNSFATGDLAPDLTILLDVPAERGRARQAAEGKEKDRIEREGDDFLDAVVAAYRELAHGEGDGIVIIDGSGPVDEVQRGIREVLKARFPEPFAAARC